MTVPPGIPPGMVPFTFDLFVPAYPPLRSGRWQVHHGENLLWPGLLEPGAAGAARRAPGGVAHARAAGHDPARSLGHPELR